MSLSLKESNVDGRLTNKLFIQPASSGTGICVGYGLCLSVSPKCCTDNTVYMTKDGNVSDCGTDILHPDRR